MPMVLTSRPPQASRRCSSLSFLSILMQKMLAAQLSHPSQQSWLDGRFRINTGANAVGSTIAIRSDKSKHEFAAFRYNPTSVAEIVSGGLHIFKSQERVSRHGKGPGNSPADAVPT